ncbi:hypothetical protein PGT21_009642 [Puccinia graminis f. sp. tritici]|uniref:Uncharacterized protein n=1 Tax=Puccinia graminis f. sp. tritici TaxID=56615 RepID=A0A5B0NFI6_PUCGR|nr:hypothetical protein PGT21_009642 [Puccinia graminis f. sp. tritici]
MPLNSGQATAIRPNNLEPDTMAGWPPSLMPLSVDEEPINNEFVSQVDTTLQLGGVYADLEQLSYVLIPRQQAVVRLRHELLSLPQSPGVAAVEVPVTVQTQNFHYVAV